VFWSNVGGNCPCVKDESLKKLKKFKGWVALKQKEEKRGSTKSIIGKEVQRRRVKHRSRTTERRWEKEKKIKTAFETDTINSDLSIQDSPLGMKGRRGTQL